mmetsp:Transcript_44535/g.59081  ORF Transcript_44535/g.59081 Transcript_44535/m.59081 type:complete len:99 (+) Transcript_44535:697-993(+)
MVDEMNHTNILNIIVTAEFLKLENVYEMAWQDYLLPKFNSIIDECSLDLTSISQKVCNDMARKVPLKNLLELKERPDKLISNIFRHRIDQLLERVSFY